MRKVALSLGIFFFLQGPAFATDVYDVLRKLPIQITEACA
jgi:hypothetical protein